MLPARKWTDDFRHWIASRPPFSTSFAIFPSYRPDLAQDLAKACEASYLDFRKQCMSPLGWRASELTLADLEAAIFNRLESGQTRIVGNAEALLSLVSETERRSWLRHIASQTPGGRAVITLVLYSGDIIGTDARAKYVFSGFDLPEESILTQLTRFA